MRKRRSVYFQSRCAWVIKAWYARAAVTYREPKKKSSQCLPGSKTSPWKSRSQKIANKTFWRLVLKETLYQQKLKCEFRKASAWTFSLPWKYFRQGLWQCGGLWTFPQIWERKAVLKWTSVFVIEPISFDLGITHVSLLKLPHVNQLLAPLLTRAHWRSWGSSWAGCQEPIFLLRLTWDCWSSCIPTAARERSSPAPRLPRALLGTALLTLPAWVPGQLAWSVLATLMPADAGTAAGCMENQSHWITASLAECNKDTWKQMLFEQILLRDCIW